MTPGAKAEPQLLVILGATGDLTQRKILPALSELFSHGQLAQNWTVLGAAVPSAQAADLAAAPSDLNDASFRELARKSLGGAASDAFVECLFYQTLGHAQAQDYQALASRIAALERERQLPGNRVFYLALPPQAVPSTIDRLGEAGLNHSSGWTRIVIEKPFGSDLDSAQKLNRDLHRHFDESQIYRIDHYLGKETVQNLLVFRFANPVFESLWNREHIEKVEITVAETLGVEHRAGYYESAGALRDMVQNHLTQLVTSTAMGLPADFAPDSMRYEKTSVLSAIPPIRPEDMALGQYERGRIDGQEVPGYREEPGVAKDSSTETFVALKLGIENLRWYGVPFYLQTGKRLPRQLSQIAVTFRQPPASIFKPYDSCGIRANRLIVTIQPDEGFDLNFEVKQPGRSICLDTQRLHFRYSEAFAPLPEAYVTLLLDVMLGDQTLFVSDDWVETSWRLYTPLLTQRPAVLPYSAGTWGPSGLQRLSWPPDALSPAEGSGGSRKAS
jgi:glucose-6-phosphate 1-dehydrogenase